MSLLWLLVPSRPIAAAAAPTLASSVNSRYSRTCAPSASSGSVDSTTAAPEEVTLTRRTASNDSATSVSSSAAVGSLLAEEGEGGDGGEQARRRVREVGRPCRGTGRECGEERHAARR
eukprot:ctg_3878.g441